MVVSSIYIIANMFCKINILLTKYVSIFVLIIVGSISMLNLNAVVYLLPYFIFEIYLLKNNFRL